jgi:uncharacterized protein
MNKYFSIISLSFLLFISVTACRSGEGGTNIDEFDRKAMLNDYASKVIVPAYQELLSSAEGLKVAKNDFMVSNSQLDLERIQAQWVSTLLAWQYASAFNFGPAGEQALRKGLIEEIATFPVDTTTLEAYIDVNDLSLNNFDRDTRGLYAIEYLLYNNDNGELRQSDIRRNYLNAIINQLVERILLIRNQWITTYPAEFVANDGTDAGSSTSLLYNEFVRSFESIKNFKLGLPLGKRPGQTAPAPELAEAYYSGQTFPALFVHINAINDLYYGRSRTESGIGLRDYLKSVVGGPELIAQSDAQWEKVTAALNAIPTDRPLTELIQTDYVLLENLHTELQKQTRFFKSDMSSLLGIAITYSSGDGD